MSINWIVRSALATLVLAASASSGYSQIVVVSSSVQERAAVGGQTYTGQIRLRNEGSAPGDVRIYQSDYLFHADGSTHYPEPGSHPRSNGKWLTVSPTRMMVPPGETVEVSYEVRTPLAVDSVPGTYWSMIMVEPVAPVSPVAPDPTRGRQPEVGLRTVVRFGIQIATHVGDTPHRLSISRQRLTADTSGARALEFELSNTGAGAFRPAVSLEVYDAGGKLVATEESQRGLIYPGTSVLQRFELSSLAPGTYEAMVVVDTGTPDVFGGQFTVTIGPQR